VVELPSIALSPEIFSSATMYFTLVMIIFPGYVYTKIIGNKYLDSLFSTIEKSAKKSKFSTNRRMDKIERVILHLISYLLVGIAYLALLCTLLYLSSLYTPLAFYNVPLGLNYNFFFFISSMEYGFLVLLWLYKKSKFNFIIDLAIFLFLLGMLSRDITVVILIAAILIRAIRILLERSFSGLFERYLVWIKEFIKEFTFGGLIVIALTLTFLIYFWLEPFSPNIAIKPVVQNESVLSLYIFNQQNEPVSILEVNIEGGAFLNGQKSISFIPPIVVGAHNYTVSSFNYTNYTKDNNIWVFTASSMFPRSNFR
jgi:hypothetical protein